VSSAPQPEEWSGERVARWLRQAPALERQLAPVSDLLFAAVALQPGESVLDVGCGTGVTTLEAARAVGVTGRVCGLDVSGEMLAAAAAASPHGAGAMAPVDWVEADAVTWAPDGPPYDAVISRFGVMFFSDPVAAFTNLARATRVGGRLAFAAWHRRDDSAAFSVPLYAALGALQSRGIRTTAAGGDLDQIMANDQEAAFSLHDPNAITRLLERGGWSRVRVEAHVLALPFAGGMGPAAAAEAALDFGPTRQLLTGMDDDVLRAAVGAISEALSAHLDGDGQVVLSGAINLVTAVKR
jgi:ubiquinone/menaquinone biosynthesis C-methylase UbiE